MADSAAQGVYTSVQELIKLRCKARGFSFLPGDDIQRIDWKVAAGTKKPHTRVYTEGGS